MAAEGNQISSFLKAFTNWCALFPSVPSLSPVGTGVRVSEHAEKHLWIEKAKGVFFKVGTDICAVVPSEHFKD